MIAGLKLTWPYVEELFTDHPLVDELGDAGVRPSTLRAPFDAAVQVVLAEADLEVPQVPGSVGGGRLGRHSEHLGYILAELQVLAREYPGASW